MTAILSFLLLLLAFGAGLRAVTANTTERLLWGMLALSICLGIGVQARGGGYYGIMMVAVFLVTDLMVYLFFRSLRLLPSSVPAMAGGDRAYRIFFLWLSLCAVVGVFVFAFVPSSPEVWMSSNSSTIELLHRRVWGGDWLLIALPFAGLATIVTGGFFLVRRDT